MDVLITEVPMYIDLLLFVRVERKNYTYIHNLLEDDTVNIIYNCRHVFFKKYKRDSCTYNHIPGMCMFWQA